MVNCKRYGESIRPRTGSRALRTINTPDAVIICLDH